MKDKLGGKIMTKLFELKIKTYSYLTDDDINSKRAKGVKTSVIKRILQSNDYKSCLFKNEVVIKLQQRVKRQAHDVYSKEFNKAALSSNDDKRLQTFDRITSYPYSTNVGKVCKT